MDVLIYAVVTGFAKIGWKILIVLAVLMVLAEALEFFLGVTGAARFGASRKAIWASFIGGFAGAAILTPYFLGLGTLIGVFMGGFLGTLAVELVRQQKMKPALRAGMGAVAGRITGIIAKGILSIAMIIITLMNIYS
jgi:uncharacterized protein YqgC (DUF456 family)